MIWTWKLDLLSIHVSVAPFLLTRYSERPPMPRLGVDPCFGRPPPVNCEPACGQGPVQMTFTNASSPKQFRQNFHSTLVVLDGQHTVEK
jgi:hypothetical protein